MKRNFNVPVKGFGGIPITENSKDSQGNAKNGTRHACLTSPTAAGLIKGDVYRSGDTLKIKTTD